MLYNLTMMDGQEYDFGEEHSPLACFCCGYCCVGYNPMVEDAEIRRMADHLAVSVDAFKREYIEETLIGYLVRQTTTGCVFLQPEEESGKGYCSIHLARPEACRDWTPSFWRRECLAGLALLKDGNGGILRATDVFEDRESLETFIRTLKQA